MISSDHLAWEIGPDISTPALKRRPDGRENPRLGIVSGVVMQPTIVGIRAGRDELLERAVPLVEHP